MDALRSIIAKVLTMVALAFESYVLPLALPLVERNLVPDFLIRWSIRLMLTRMVTQQDARTAEQLAALKQAYVDDLKARQLAEHTADANEQHYEVPADFYSLVMGKYKKYSCGLWDPSTPRGLAGLDASEEAALRLVCERAELASLRPGSRILDMGCGWGSFSLFASAAFPQLTFVGVSNSNSQRRFIMDQAAQRGIKNLTIVTADINVFTGQDLNFDRVVSIEMMEHVKNYELLLARISSWLKPGGKLFVHIFTAKSTPFHYTEGWMAEKFFSGGQMPSHDLLWRFQRNLTMEACWAVQGQHYAETCEAWLQKVDANRRAALGVLGGVYGAKQALPRLVDWRLFFIACAEFFAFKGGNEWFVSHYRFVNAHPAQDAELVAPVAAPAAGAGAAARR